MIDAPLPSPGFPTFLFTDIVGSTKAARRIPYRDYRGELLDPQFAAFSKLITEHNGQECGTPAGDSILAAFADVHDALRCAVAMQQVMPTIRHTDHDGNVTTLAARIGMHTSEQQIAPGDYLNHPEVIHAARIMAISNGGQIIFSDHTRIVAGAIPWKMRCWQSRRIKDWEEAPEDIYELLYDGDESRPEPGYLYTPDWFREFNRYIPRPQLEKEVLGLFEKLPNGTLNRLVTLHGFGGMGKTRLAVQCCLLAAGSFSGNLRLVRLETIGDSVLPNDHTRAEFLTGRIAEAFEKIDRDGLTPANLPDRLPTEKCLLLLDNFETVHGPEALKLVFAMLDRRPSLHIMITSREAVKISSIGRVKEIVGMERDAGRNLLVARIELKRSGWKESAADTKAIERLLDLTECIPLALELVAAHADEYTLTEIADSLESNILGEMTGPAEGEFNFDESGRHHSLENCFFWSWKLLPEEARQALIRLCLFANHCSAAEISSCFPTVQQRQLTALMNASFAIRTEAGGISVYDLLNPTRAFSRARLMEQDNDTAIRRQFIAYYWQFVEENGGLDNLDNVNKRACMERSWQHAISAAEIAAELEDVDNCGTIADGMIHFFHRRAMWSDGIPLFERSLGVRRACLPEDDPDIADSLNNLAHLYHMQGRYEEAESLHKEALQIRQNLLPAGHLDIALSLDNLANLYQAQGRYKEAESLYKQILQIRLNALPDGHLDIATCLNNLAELYRVQGRYEEAEPFCQQALEIRQNALPEGHPDIAMSLNNLALLHVSRGRFEEAELFYTQALRTFKDSLSQKHPDIATCVNNIAELYRTQGRDEEAELLHKQALEIRQNALPEGHPLIAMSLNNLALLHASRGQFEEAESTLRQVLRIYQNALPEGHPDIATSLNNLAQLYQMQGRYEEAESLYEQALQIRINALPAGHLDISMSLNNLALLYDNSGRHDEAEPLYKRALGVLLTAQWAQYPQTTLVLDNYRQLMIKQGREAEFEAFVAARLGVASDDSPGG